MFRLEIATDSNAFVEGAHDELARILLLLSGKLRHGEASLEDGGILRDVNGNAVGQWQYTDE